MWRGDLEPYRGFPLIMRSLAHLLRARKDVRVVIVGGDGVSYGAPPSKGTWREAMLTELGDKLDLSRVTFPGKVDYNTYLSLLHRSDAHVYLTYPFVASWSLREAIGRGVRGGRQRYAAGAGIRYARRERLPTSFFDPKGFGAKHPARAGGCSAGAPVARGGAAVCRGATFRWRSIWMRMKH